MQTRARHDIRDYGAVPNDESFKAEMLNQAAFEIAIEAANATESMSDREVYVPGNMTFNMFPIDSSNLYNLTITIDGTVRMSKRHHAYPLDERNKTKHMLLFTECHNFTIRGNGTVDG